MNLIFSPFLLPKELTQLCSQVIRAEKNSYDLISDKILASPFLCMATERMFQQRVERAGLHKAISLSGWESLRNHLGAMYYNKYQYGEYDFTVKPACTKRALELEDRFRHLTIHGTSRAYLLGLYLDFQELQMSKGLAPKGPIDIPLEVDKILNTSRVKHFEIDLLIILVWHFFSFFKEEALKKIEATNGSYYKIVDDLNDDQKIILMNNFLNYGHSIYFSELFVEENSQ